MCSREEEKKWLDQGFRRVVGLDEAGAGCLAGPVTVCACYLPPHVDLPGINDSKKLSPRRREMLYDQLTRHPDVKYALVHIDAGIIDQINILQARFRGFYEAFQQLRAQVPDIDVVLLDGNQRPPQLAREAVTVATIVGGDAKVMCIGAASILAKVTRDRLMVHYDQVYPGYGLAVHKGYYQPLHIEALQRLGPSPLHRLTYRGVVQPTAPTTDPSSIVTPFSL